MADELKQLDATERQSILARRITSFINMGGWAVETQGGFNAVLVSRGKKTHHALHFLLTLLTGGLWTIGWVMAVRRNRGKRISLFVDEFGNINEGAAA